MFLSAVSKQFLTEVIPVTKSVFKDYRVVNVIAGIIQVPELKNKFLSHIKNSIQFINSHLSKNDLLYSISKPAGFPVSSNFEFAKILMSLNNKKGFDIFFHLIQKASPVGVWPTAIHPVSAGGSDREGHDGKASADFILLMMEMLFDDREKDTLTLLKWCPEEWIDTKKPIVVKDARVKYGLFSFTFEKKKDYFKCKINHQFKNLPKLMSIKFPVKVTQIKIGSKWLKNHTKQVVLPFTSEEIMFYFSHEPEKK